jgi:hypothetical protein
MDTKKKIFVFILILLLLFGGSSTIKEANLFQENNEAYAVAGLLSVMPEDAFIEVDPDPVEEDCQCNKKTGKIKYDGTIEETCPCANDGKPCGCINCNKGEAPAETHKALTMEEVLDLYFVMKFTATWCGPCVQWDKNEKHKLEELNIKVESVYDTKIHKAFDVSSIPVFWICLKEGRKSYKGYKWAGYRSAEKLIEDIKRLDKSLNPDREIYNTTVSKAPSDLPNGYPFYVWNGKQRWSLNGNVYPSKRTLINHFRNHREHANLRDWPLEDLSEQELQWIHWDDHSKTLGKIQWK